MDWFTNSKRCFDIKFHTAQQLRDFLCFLSIGCIGSLLRNKQGTARVKVS